MSSRSLITLIAGMISVCPVSANVRVFMSADGEQFGQPVTGATFIFMEPDSTAKIIVWMEDTTEFGDELSGYQIIMRDDADPREGATGSINYVNIQPGEPGGDTMFIDNNRLDWVYANLPILVPAHYNETPPANIFGVIYALPLGLSVNPSQLKGIRYLCEFEFRATVDASGTFDLRFNLDPRPPPLSALFSEFGAEYIVNTKYQPLTITVGSPAPLVSGPPDGAVDARQAADPTAKGDAGWREFEIMFASPTEAAVDDFAVETTGDVDLMIEELISAEHGVTLRLDQPIPAGECTTIHHLPSGWHTRVGFLPGDVDGDHLSGVLDILALVDHLNGALDPPAALWQCDIDRSGACDPQDILRLIDVLNGANQDAAWNNATLPPCDD